MIQCSQTHYEFFKRVNYVWKCQNEAHNYTAIRNKCNSFAQSLLIESGAWLE